MGACFLLRPTYVDISNIQESPFKPALPAFGYHFETQGNENENPSQRILTSGGSRAAWLAAVPYPILCFIGISKGEHLKCSCVGIWIVRWVGTILN